MPMSVQTINTGNIGERGREERRCEPNFGENFGSEEANAGDGEECVCGLVSLATAYAYADNQCSRTHDGDGEEEGMSTSMNCPSAAPAAQNPASRSYIKRPCRSLGCPAGESREWP